LAIERWDIFGEMMSSRDAMNQLFRRTLWPSLATTQAREVGQKT
jgi:hypothetical protein